MSATSKTTPECELFNSRLNTSGGVIHYQWEENMPVTTNGYLPFFAEFLHAGGRFDALVKSCPLKYRSNNAPRVRDVLGTAMVSILSGHTRYRQAGALYGDTIPAQCLDLKKFVSYDSLRRAFANTEEEKIVSWLEKQLFDCCEPLLGNAYILDLDPTVKILYGNQEGAKIGYNPKKPGRPSHCLHTFCVAGARLLLNVEVRPGNETAGKYSHDGLWRLLDCQLPRNRYPRLIRGDIGFGNEETMAGCESRQVNYLFKLRQSANVKKLIEMLSTGNASSDWQNAGQGWQGYETRLQLMGWSCSRRVIALRRLHTAKPREENRKIVSTMPPAQDDLLAELLPDDTPVPEYEWAILVTDLTDAIPAVAQLYRDRGDAENIFDELKNQWGWNGFTTRDLKRTNVMAQLTALVYNWWNIFCRLAESERHIEAETSRMTIQNVIGRLTNTGGRRLLHLCASGSQGKSTMVAFNRIAAFLSSLFSTAAQLAVEQRWAKILAEAFKSFLHSDTLSPGEIGGQFILPLA